MLITDRPFTARAKCGSIRPLRGRPPTTGARDWPEPCRENTMKVLAINPGGTSTKIAVFDDERELFNSNVQHSEERINAFPSVASQRDYRKQTILAELGERGLSLADCECDVGRGGRLKSIPGGHYRGTAARPDDLPNACFGEHPGKHGLVRA